MSDDLVAFLRARLDEDQQWADRVIAKSVERGWTSEDDAWDDMGFAGLHEHAWATQGKRTLAEVDAKRRIVDECDAARDNLSKSAANYSAWANNEPEPYPDVRGSGAESLIPGLVRAVWLLALPYADHPSYRPEWRP